MKIEDLGKLIEAKKTLETKIEKLKTMKLKSCGYEHNCASICFKSSVMPHIFIEDDGIKDAIIDKAIERLEYQLIDVADTVHKVQSLIAEV